MRLLLLLAVASRLAAQDSTTALVDRAAREYRAAHSVRATFDQTLSSAATGGSHVAHGEYFQSTGSRFALRFADPGGDEIVSDGTSLWLYLPSSAKGQVIKMPSQVGEGLDVLSALLSAPKNNYTVAHLRDETIDTHATSVFSLTPKRADLPFSRATLWIGKSDALLWQLETVEQSGLVRRVRFTSIHTNVELPADAFTFVPPAGVRVIDQAALFGKKP